MNREEAAAEAARRGREDPDRNRYSWIPRQAPDGTWEIARIGVPSAPVEEHTATKPPPVPPQEDPLGGRPRPEWGIG